MKLVLASAGFATPEIIRTAASLAGKPAAHISVAVINEGYAPEHGDHRWVIDELDATARGFGGRIELVNLLVLSAEAAAERISHSDIIYVLGGPNDYLMSVFTKTGFAARLPGLLADRVYVGSSAGAMLLGRRISTEAYRTVYNEPLDYGVDRYLELADCAIMPHLDRPDFPACTEATLREVASSFAGPLYALRDDAAIVIAGGKQYTIGSPALVLGQ